MPSKYLDLLLSLLKGTPFEPVAVAVRQALADGRIKIEEADELIVAATESAEEYFPNQLPEIHLVKNIAVAIGKFQEEKEEQKDKEGKEKQKTEEKEKKEAKKDPAR